jgi:hypothetical protein
MILQPYLHMTSHKYIYLHANMQRLLNLTLRASTSFKGLPPSINDPISNLNHAAEAFEVDLHQPYSCGAGSLAVLVKSISAVRPYFHMSSRHALSPALAQFPVS